MIKIIPVFSEKIWGGNNLKKYGFDIPSNHTGEAWIISGYKDNSSIIENSDNLNFYYKENKFLFNNYPTKEFPLLVKILDAKENLSIQVHPNNKKAIELENYAFGKTECWYILDVEKDTNIIIDINASKKEEAEVLINNNEWDKLLKKHPVKKDDIFNISSGTVHAILGGTMVYELQQSSDITYRLYDFDRVDSLGKKRDLNIKKALYVIDYNITDYKKIPQKILEKRNLKIYSLIKNKFFSLEKWEISGKEIISFQKNEKNFLLITVISGMVIINKMEIKEFESAILTADELSKISINGNAIILVGNPN